MQRSLLCSNLQQAINAIQEWATRNGIKFAAQKCKVIHSTAPQYKVQRSMWSRLVKHFCWWRSQRCSSGCGGTRALLLRSTSVCYRHSAGRLWTLIKWSLTWSGEGTDTLLMLYRAIVCSKLDYGFIVHGTGSNTNLRQMDSIHNSRLKLALGAFCTIWKCEPALTVNLTAPLEPVFVSEYLRDRRIRVRIGTKLWRILPRGRCSNWRCPGCDMFWTED